MIQPDPANPSDPATLGLPVSVSRRRRMVDQGLVPKLLKVAGRIPFAEDLAAAWFCLIDETTPTRVKGVLLTALAYFVLPADMLPDLLAVIGFTDDAAVLAASLGFVGAHLKDRHYDQARALLRRPKPASEPLS
ncbi:MAG: YkvA family protein [Maricaulaceae bacterium]